MRRVFMSLKDNILEDIKVAMKEKDTKKLEVLRFVNAQIKNREIEVRPETITDSDIIKVLKKYIKQRRESMEQFKSHGRDDLVEAESYQAEVVEAYLPKMMSEDEVKTIVKQVITETGASSMKDMGSVMKGVMAKTGDLADSKMLSQMVKSELGA
jgi:uncharacterized protein YqeY